MSVRTFSMRRAKPPAGHIELVEALQTCAIKWECARDAAWPKLRSALIDGRVGSVRRENDETEKNIDPITWRAIENDSAGVTGLHEHPGPLRFNFIKVAVAYVDKIHLESLLADPLFSQREDGAARDDDGAVEGSGSQRGRKKNVDAGAFWAEINRLVDDGLQADPHVAAHTAEKLTDVMELWASRNMQKPYRRSTIHRYIEDAWATLLERSRTRII